MIIGYGRTSTIEQVAGLEAQIPRVTELGAWQRSDKTKPAHIEPLISGLAACAPPSRANHRDLARGQSHRSLPP